MTVENDIFSALKSLCANRVYPDIAPANAAKPYVTFTQIGGEVVNLIEDAVVTVKNGRFQFNVWGTTRAQCSALILQIEEALVVSPLFQARPIGAARSDYDYDMALFGAMQDFSVWSNR